MNYPLSLFALLACIDVCAYPHGSVNLHMSLEFGWHELVVLDSSIC